MVWDQQSMQVKKKCSSRTQRELSQRFQRLVTELRERENRIVVEVKLGMTARNSSLYSTRAFTMQAPRESDLCPLGPP